MTGGIETEVQFQYRGQEVPVVPTELLELVLGCSERQLIVDVYYDTAGLDLRRAGSSLRIRQSEISSQPTLTWKGKSSKQGRAKRRGETEVPLDSLPDSGDELIHLLDRLGLWEGVRKAGKLGRESAVSEIGRLQNNRSSHTYLGGLKHLELTWDRLHYPKGPDEIRLEVEVKSHRAASDLHRVSSELEDLFDGKLVEPERGKLAELCHRLYPDVL